MSNISNLKSAVTTWAGIAEPTDGDNATLVSAIKSVHGATRNANYAAMMQIVAAADVERIQPFMAVWDSAIQKVSRVETPTVAESDRATINAQIEKLLVNDLELLLFSSTDDRPALIERNDVADLYLAKLRTAVFATTQKVAEKGRSTTRTEMNRTIAELFTILGIESNTIRISHKFDDRGTVTVTLNRNGNVTVPKGIDGCNPGSYKSVSGAAKACGSHVNGWSFWSYTDSEKVTRTLKAIYDSALDSSTESSADDSDDADDSSSDDVAESSTDVAESSEEATE